ncbi:MAG: hypothetical protein GQ570_12005 [Helicobacteraceae bacterium]|nr:hypothetical protein [Helicobacteraceae bacterium]
MIMLKKISYLLFVVTLYQTTLNAVIHHDNQLNFIVNSESDARMVAITSITPANIQGLDLGYTIECSDPKGDYGSVIGVATSNESEHSHDDTYQYGDQGTYSCIYANDFSNDEASQLKVEVGRSGSTTVGNMFRDFSNDAISGSSAFVLNNQNAFKNDVNTCSNPAVVGGMPTGLNFFILTDINLILVEPGTTTNIECDNILLGQQGTGNYLPNAVHQFITGISAAVKVGQDIGKIVATDGEDADNEGTWTSMGKSTVKAIGGIASGVETLLETRNYWWLGQMYNNSNERLSFMTNGTDGPSAYLPANQDITALMCSESGGPRTFFLMVTEDIYSDDHFNLELVDYNLTGDDK